MVESPNNSRRHETDREDIMREAAALVRRISFSADGLPSPIVAGFRRTGFFAVYFDQDPVYQFDAKGLLRRAFRHGLLYRTQGTTLAELRRERTEAATTLLRTDLTTEQLDLFLDEMNRFLTKLSTAIRHGHAEATAQIPTDDIQLTSDIQAAIDAAISTRSLAPAIPTKRR